MAHDEARRGARPQASSFGLKRDVDWWSLALGLLLALAVVATVIMLFTDDRQWMRIGTLAALWSAFIGAFLVGRYRRQAATETARVKDLNTVYELQLEREVNARYEYELEVEKRQRELVGAQNDESIQALRLEIYALRDQLSKLTGQPLGEDMPTLSGGRQQAVPERTSVPSERVEPRESFGGSRPGSLYGRPSGYGSRPARGGMQQRPSVPPRPMTARGRSDDADMGRSAERAQATDKTPGAEKSQATETKPGADKAQAAGKSPGADKARATTPTAHQPGQQPTQEPGTEGVQGPTDPTKPSRQRTSLREEFGLGGAAAPASSGQKTGTSRGPSTEEGASPASPASPASADRPGSKGAGDAPGGQAPGKSRGQRTRGQTRGQARGQAPRTQTSRGPARGQTRDQARGQRQETGDSQRAAQGGEAAAKSGGVTSADKSTRGGNDVTAKGGGARSRTEPSQPKQETSPVGESSARHARPEGRRSAGEGAPETEARPGASTNKHTEGNSVAELMARLKAEAGEAGGGRGRR